MSLVAKGQGLEVVLHVGGRPEVLAVHVLAADESQWVVSRPSRAGLPVPVDVDRVPVSFAAADAVYGFTAAVRSVRPAELVLDAPDPGAIARTQRREHVRSRTALAAQVEIAADGRFARPVPGILEDLSGGGCRLRFTPTIPVGTPVRLRFDLPGEGPFELLGKVVRSVVGSAPDAESGVFFSGIHERDRDRIVKFVFGQLRDEARKARGAGA